MPRLNVSADERPVGFFIIKNPTDLLIEWQVHSSIPEKYCSLNNIHFHAEFDFLGVENVHRKETGDWMIHFYFARKGHYTFYNQDSEKIGTEDKDECEIDIQYV